MSPTQSTFLVAGLAATALASSALFFSSSAAAVEPSFSVSHLVVSARRVSDSVIMQVQPGMTREAITSLVGPPARTMRFPLSRTTSWDYDFVDSWGYASELSVIFGDDGLVVSKVTSRNDY
jgi:outer membrane protein assembly factor BamE (lipoprotein component of BamABCDE complex)